MVNITPKRLAALAAVAGPVLLLTWVVLVLVFLAPAYLSWPAGLLGLATTGLYVYLEWAAVRAFLLAPRLRHGGNAAAFSAAVVAIVMLLNVVTTRHSFRLDLTAEKFYSLSPQTKKALKGLEREVMITAFFKDGSAEKEKLRDLLKEYRHETGKIKVEFVDPDKEPAKAQLYKVANYNTTVLESGSKRKDILAHEMFGYQFRGRQTQQEFKGESVLTSGILSVIQDEQLTVYFLEGHGERSIDDPSENGIEQIKQQLERDNYAIKSVNVLKDGVLPVDASLLVIAGAQSLIPKPEREVLREWLKGEGRMLVLLDSRTTAGLADLLEDWGIEALAGVVVDPRSNYFFAGPLVPIPSYRSHEITRDLMQEEVGSVFPVTRAIDTKPGGNFSISPLLVTTSESWMEKTPENPKRDSDEKRGPLTLAAAVSVTSTQIGEDAPAPSPKLVVFACSEFVANKIRNLSEGNFNLFGNSVSWLLGSEEAISIRPKELERRPLFLSKVKANLMWYTTVLFAPLAVVGIGILRWWRRRSL